MTHTQLQDVLEKMSLATAEEIAAGSGFAVTQNWIDDLFITLTMVNLREGFWTIGYPVPGEYLTVTPHFEEALALVCQLAEPVAESYIIPEVQHDLFALA